MVGTHSVSGWFAAALEGWMIFAVLGVIVVLIASVVRRHFSHLPARLGLWALIAAIVGLSVAPLTVFDEHEQASEGPSRGSCIGCGIPLLVGIGAAIALYGAATERLGYRRGDDAMSPDDGRP